MPSSTPAPAAPGRVLGRLLPGLAAAAAVVAAAFGLHALLPGAPALSLCVLLGALASNLPWGPAAARGRTGAAGGKARVSPGMAWAARHLMRAGIVLLGLQLVLADVAALGVGGVAAIAVAVAVAFGGTWLAAKLFRLPGDQPVLLAAGFSICGASAIGAMAQARGSQRDAPVPVALVTLCGTLAIAALPAANAALGLGAVDFGRWVGASVHDVGQVVATAQTAGAAALAAAVVVKLVRVLALAPVTLLGALAARRAPGGGAARAGAPLVPLFVAGFAAMVALRSTGLLPDAVLDAAAVAQHLLLAGALVGLGFAIDVRALFRTAWRATAAALTAWLVVAAAGLGAVAAMAA
ncbi:putative sulfate exporter family transporter [Arthrobacter halodurans]|uniref:Sulfate exporter family transporter n=1 Tax=Arthrobacter halodurans TaxID=516699 RepID=A0ABV4UPL8_9MICC